LIVSWLKIDKAFWGQIKNNSLQEFQQVGFKYEQPLIVERPEKS